MPQQQHGGAKYFIGGLTPEIESPEALEEKCEFFYVSGHGYTELRGWAVVPENTFIVYIGFSGFLTKVAHKAEWLIHAPTRDDYFKGMFDTYFQEKGSSWKSRPYANQHVYVPGDLLPITTIDFKSGIQNRWDKGVFQCPVKDPVAFDIEAPENNYVYVLSNLLDRPGAREIIPLAKPKQPDWDTFVALSKEERLRFLEDNPDKKKINAWFDKPQDLPNLTDIVFENSRENVFKRFYPYQSAATLPAIVSMVQDLPKKYKFIIVNSCRPPLNFLKQVPDFWYLEDKMKDVIGLPNPRNLPEEVNERRTLARRASFSAKPSKEICATTDDPPMNLTRVLAALDNATKALPFGPKEDKFIKDLNEMFYGRRADVREVVKWISIRYIADLFLNRVFVPYPILTSDDAEKRDIFTGLIQSIQAALGAFMVGVHFDSKTDEKRFQLLGRQLLEQAGYQDEEQRLNNIADILKAQWAFVEDPKWTALRTPRSDLKRMAQKGQILMIEKDYQNSLLPPNDPRRIDYERRKKLHENAQKARQYENRMSRSNRDRPPPVVSPVRAPVAPNTTRSRPLWNEKELLKWRVQWLAGERNPKRDEARLKQWAAYRQGLTAEERRDQNRNLTRRARNRRE